MVGGKSAAGAMFALDEQVKHMGVAKPKPKPKPARCWPQRPEK